MTHASPTQRHCLSGALLAIVLAPIGTPIARADPIELKLPIDCDVGRTCVVQNYMDHDPTAGARDFSCGTLTYDGHDGTDFRLPTTVAQRAGVEVRAAADGWVLRTRDGMSDVSQSISQAPSVNGHECGNGVVLMHRNNWQTQYCHLARDSVLVKAGEQVSAGQSIGRVGLSGRTEFPHLHLTVRHQGRVVDPFAYGARSGTCRTGESLWESSLRGALSYRPRIVLNFGFVQQAVTNEMIEMGALGATSPWTDAAVLAAFVRTVGLKAMDVQRLTITAPDGQILATHTDSPLDRDKAQFTKFVGKKRPIGGWPRGTYHARYSVNHGDHEVLEFAFELAF